jgi:anti-sigma B factor antagonist
MTTGKPVVVKRLPERLDARQCEVLLRELSPSLEGDRPCLVFDFSKVHHFNSSGIELLLRCMEEAMKRNGDLKLSGVSPSLAVIFEMTRIDRLFEIFENCDDAVESFHRFSAPALRQASMRQWLMPAHQDEDQSKSPS